MASLQLAHEDPDLVVGKRKGRFDLRVELVLVIGFELLEQVADCRQHIQATVLHQENEEVAGGTVEPLSADPQQRALDIVLRELRVVQNFLHAIVLVDAYQERKHVRPLHELVPGFGMTEGSRSVGPSDGYGFGHFRLSASGFLKGRRRLR
jgi:hypothetical protein